MTDYGNSSLARRNRRAFKWTLRRMCVGILIVAKIPEVKVDPITGQAFQGAFGSRMTERILPIPRGPLDSGEAAVQQTPFFAITQNPQIACVAHCRSRQ